MIDLSNYSCDKCAREFSWHCKHCWHTVDKPPTRFKKKKKTGVQTPEFRKPTPPPPPPTSGSNAVKPKHIARGYIGTKESFVHFTDQHDGLVKIENAEIYWIDESESIVVVASPEWRDYLMGRKDAPIVEKEN